MTGLSTIVIPIKGLQTGKSRLARLISDDARFDLNRFLAERTLKTAAELSSEATTYVVSPDPTIREISDRYGAVFFHQSVDGLNAGLEQAAEQLPDRRTVYIVVDLPNVVTGDIRALTAETGIAIAPDKIGRGTNALSVSAPRLIQFCFGPDSYRLHSEQACATGIPVTTIDRPGLAFDLDTKSDLDRIKGWPSVTNPRSLPRC